MYFFIGGYHGYDKYGYHGERRKEIVEFNQETESWTVIEAMKEPKYGHGVSVVSLDDYKKWCN